MPPDYGIGDRQARGRAGYLLFRGLIRIWFKLTHRPIRVLGEELHLPRSAPILLVAGHPPSLAASLVLIAALDIPVRCVLGAEHIRGFWARIAARGLGIILDAGDAAGHDAACRAADRGEALVAFADLERASANGSSTFGARTAHLVAELVGRLVGSDPTGAGAAPLELIPVHVFMPQRPLDSSQVLIHLEPPVRPDAESEGSRANEAFGAKELLAALEPALRRNVFRLRPADLRDFLSDIEDALRQELELKPVTPPERKAPLDGFALSEFLVDWAEQENRADPGRLVTLRGELDAWRELQRIAALRGIETETCGPWLDSALRRGAAWAETVAGLPVAVFGLVNSLIPLAVLKTSGLARIAKRAENPRRWFARAGIVLSIFAAQTLACYGRWGRSVAGVYAVAAPVSALYLWRYAWLVRHRSRLLFSKLLNLRARAQIEKLRRRLLEDLGRARDAYAERLGVAH